MKKILQCRVSCPTNKVGQLEQIDVWIEHHLPALYNVSILSAIPFKNGNIKFQINNNSGEIIKCSRAGYIELGCDVIHVTYDADYDQYIINICRDYDE